MPPMTMDVVHSRAKEQLALTRADIDTPTTNDLHDTDVLASALFTCC